MSPVSTRRLVAILTRDYRPLAGLADVDDTLSKLGVSGLSRRCSRVHGSRVGRELPLLSEQGATCRFRFSRPGRLQPMGAIDVADMMSGMREPYSSLSFIHRHLSHS